MAEEQMIRWGQALRELINYEKENGKLGTLHKYHPMANELLTPLNEDIPSIYGPVDVDWMLRVAPSCMSLLTGYAFYAGAKTFWNTARGVLSWFTPDSPYSFGYGSIFQIGNRNAPRVAYAWLRMDNTLEMLFKPALEMLG